MHAVFIRNHGSYGLSTILLVAWLLGTCTTLLLPSVLVVRAQGDDTAGTTAPTEAAGGGGDATTTTTTPTEGAGEDTAATTAKPKGMKIIRVKCTSSTADIADASRVLQRLQNANWPTAFIDGSNEQFSNLFNNAQIQQLYVTKCTGRYPPPSSDDDEDKEPIVSQYTACDDANVPLSCVSRVEYNGSVCASARFCGKPGGTTSTGVALDQGTNYALDCSNIASDENNLKAPGVIDCGEPFYLIDLSTTAEGGKEPLIGSVTETSSSTTATRMLRHGGSCLPISTVFAAILAVVILG